MRIHGSESSVTASGYPELRPAWRIPRARQAGLFTASGIKTRPCSFNFIAFIGRLSSQALHKSDLRLNLRHHVSTTTTIT